MRKKKFKMIAVMSALLVAAASMNAFASELGDGWHLDPLGWQKNDTGWWYANDDKGASWYHDGWFWIDGNGDDTAECYYFDKDGYLFADTTTPDGYAVNSSGQWTVNGTVQTKYAGMDEWGYVKAIINDDRPGWVTFDGQTLYEIKNGGYDENGVSRTAMDLANGTSAENAAKYTVVYNTGVTGTIGYSNGFIREYFKLGSNASDVGLSRNCPENATYLYKYFKAGTDPRDFAKELRAMGYRASANDGYGSVDDLNGHSIIYDDDNLRLCTLVHE